ncbi:ATP-binding cassette domain-containing protein [Sphingomonas sp.]|uniref:ATP-binding cassette domain-containing protein n=1 Tax=Sphingomonas sp. TaxID=28214 RepID=UPI003B3BB4CB
MSGGIEAHFKATLGTLLLDVAFDVPATGVTSLFGRSGSGKTTILRCLAGLERAFGVVRVSGAIWQDDRTFLPPQHRRVGFVFQGANLLPHLSVGANLAYAARRAADPLPVSDIVERTGIGALLNRMPGRLSGGEAQRIAIARALLIRPRMLLLDEPLSALDSGAKADLTDYLATLLPALAMPVFLVSHDAAEVARLAERRILIEDGRVTGIEPVTPCAHPAVSG